MIYTTKDKFTNKLYLILVILIISLNTYCQDPYRNNEIDSDKLKIGYHNDNFRRHHLVLMFGVESSNSYLNQDYSNKTLRVPAFGLNYSYWLDDGLGFGFKSMLGLSEYQLKNGDTSLIMRTYPLSASLQMVFNPLFGLLFTMGPGIEIERHENLLILNFGIGYILRIWNQFDLTPELFYNFKESVSPAYGISINFGWRFGSQDVLK